MRITNNGLVGIGSSVVPTVRLDVQGNDAAQRIRSYATGDATVSTDLFASYMDAVSNTTTSFFLGASDANGSLDVEFRLRGDGSGYADTTWTTPATDFAEYFPTDYPDLEPGRLVSLDKTAEGKIKPATSDERSSLVGVISTSPGFVGGVGDNMNHENDPNYKIIGLLGQVPTLVSAENGSIEVGDSITISSTVGVGMKATSVGRVVGQALEPYDGTGSGEIMVMVNPGWYDPGVLVDPAGAVAQTNPDGTTTTIASPVVEAEEGIFQRLTATVLATFNKLVAKTAEIASAFIKKLTVESLAVKGESVGQAMIPAGELEISVAYPELTETSKVFFTLDRAVAVGVEKTVGTGFKFLLAYPADLPVTIDYWTIE